MKHTTILILFLLMFRIGLQAQTDYGLDSVQLIKQNRLKHYFEQLAYKYYNWSFGESLVAEMFDDELKDWLRQATAGKICYKDEVLYDLALKQSGGRGLNLFIEEIDALIKKDNGVSIDIDLVRESFRAIFTQIVKEQFAQCVPAGNHFFLMAGLSGDTSFISYFLDSLDYRNQPPKLVVDMALARLGHAPAEKRIFDTFDTWKNFKVNDFEYCKGTEQEYFDPGKAGYLFRKSGGNSIESTENQVLYVLEYLNTPASVERWLECQIGHVRYRSREDKCIFDHQGYFDEICPDEPMWLSYDSTKMWAYGPYYPNELSDLLKYVAIHLDDSETRVHLDKEYKSFAPRFSNYLFEEKARSEDASMSLDVSLFCTTSREYWKRVKEFLLDNKKQIAQHLRFSDEVYIDTNF